MHYSPMYVVISPVRDEEKFIEYTMQSMISQTVKPLFWVIVNDGSKDKTREIRNSHQQVLRETRRLQNRSTLKLGAAMTGIAGMGVILLFTQFMTLGVLAMSATGGALLGYGIRARQYPALGRSTDAAAGNLPGKPVGQGRVLAGEKVAKDDGD